ncbi:hypothetical protein KKC32_02320 [Patescibacteria group bacterium]|nr:hypothetical protein [Patescibacteria group bacterium]
MEILSDKKLVAEYLSGNEKSATVNGKANDDGSISAESIQLRPESAIAQ